MRILVSGSNGQLGMELTQIAQYYPDWSFTFFNHADWDITDERLSNSIIKDSGAHVLINTAAYTKVDLAESESDLCFRVNALGPKILASACKQTETLLIHLSTDYVFHQNEAVLLKEGDKKNPMGVYAQSKSDGEDAVLFENPESLIIRCSWLYSSYGHNFVKTMLRLGQSQPLLRVVKDQRGSPTYAEDLAKTILEIIRLKSMSPEVFQPGVFHYCNEGLCSWLEFAAEIFAYCGIEVELRGITTLEYAAAAPRPYFSGLDCTKIKNTFHIEIPEWKESLHHCLDKIRNPQIIR